MSDDVTVTVPHPQGDVEMPLAQALAIAECLRAFRGAGTWHRNDCGCCVTVHANVEHPTSGYIVGSDGGYNWMQER